ncbi:MAG: DUF2812 domain-containing protein [Ruminococcaceae bacterium]|nr:DUF2812 domain-containing protein [Oscillospiraceae bacterium]
MSMQWKSVPAPLALWDPGAIEQWLEEEAKQGWKLYECGNRLARLEAVEPMDCRVRLQPEKAENWTARQERREVYRELGWNFAAELRTYEVYYCEDPGAAELNTDPVAQQWAWEKSLKRENRNNWLSLAAVVLAMSVLVKVLLSTGQPVETMIRSGLVWPLNLVLLPWFLVEFFLRMRALRRVRRQLAAGVELSHRGDWKRMRRRAVFEFAFSWILWGVLMINNLLPIVFSPQPLSLEEPQVPLPYVAAEELEKTLDPAERTGGYGYQRRSAFGMMVSYEIRERYPEQKQVETNCYCLRLPGLAKPLYTEQKNNFLKVWPSAEEVPVEHFAFDEVVLLEGGEQVRLFLARKNGCVFSVWVNFPVDLTDNVEAFAQVVAAFS